MTIEIEPHSPEWNWQADTEAERWSTALGAALVAVHHIGSTAVPTLSARPVIDLLPGTRAGGGPREPEEGSRRWKAMGYEWLGARGLSRGRVCRRTDPETGRRLMQVRCWPSGDPEIRRHLAFRDALRADPLLASG